jgi:hypothetical protein
MPNMQSRRDQDLLFRASNLRRKTGAQLVRGGGSSEYNKANKNCKKAILNQL